MCQKVFPNLRRIPKHRNLHTGKQPSFRGTCQHIKIGGSHPGITPKGSSPGGDPSKYTDNEKDSHFTYRQGVGEYCKGTQTNTF
jgi:hypothetical protein